MARWIDQVFQLDLLKGLSLTLRNLFSPVVTERYPEVKPALPERFRGAQVLRRHPEGKERCVGCGLCVAICPSRAITLMTSMGEDGSKRVDSYVIDLGYCIYCGFCQEVCPVDAVFMGRDFELATTDPGSLKVGKEELLAKGDQPEYRKL